MGFQIEGDSNVDGIPVYTNYDGPGQDRVLFTKNIVKMELHLTVFPGSAITSAHILPMPVPPGGNIIEQVSF